jgi:hypothetical protein
VVREKFGMKQMVTVGDRAMITSARIDAVRELGEMGRADARCAPRRSRHSPPRTRRCNGASSMSRTSPRSPTPTTPVNRLIACRNPLLAAERARKRQDPLRATENALAPIIARVAAGTPTGADDIGVAVGKVVNKYTMATHVTLAITDTTLAITRTTNQIDAEAALDGIYVLRTPIPADQLDPPGVVTAYKNLAHVERAPTIKADDPDLRPTHHRLDERVRSHVLIRMLAAYLLWHLRTTWAPLTFTDQTPPQRDNPVAPTRRSHAAAAKASYQHDESGHPHRSLRGLLDHLATLTRRRRHRHRHRPDRAHPRRTHHRPASRLRPHRHHHPPTLT